MVGDQLINPIVEVCITYYKDSYCFGGMTIPNISSLGLLGEMIKFDEESFQMGWNQLVSWWGEEPKFPDVLFRI